jgi:hypothetical protein
MVFSYLHLLDALVFGTMRIPTNHNRLQKLRLRERKASGNLSEQKAKHANRAEAWAFGVGGRPV